MQMYTAPHAVNPRRVELFLAAHELTADAIGLTRTPIDLSTGENRAADFLAVNPLGQLPALQLDDGTMLYESVAICRYLDSLPAFQEKRLQLFGSAGLSAAQVEQFSRQAEWEVLVPMMLAFQHGHAFWAGKKTQIAEMVPLVTAQAERGMDYFEQVLADDRTYLVDQRLSMADLTLYAALHFGKLPKIRVNESRPQLFAFYERMHQRFGTV